MGGKIVDHLMFCRIPVVCHLLYIFGFTVFLNLFCFQWSCGVILYAMVTGRLPFDDDNIQRLLLKVQAGQFHLPSDLPEDLRSLIKAMLTVDPDQRITLEGIKAHPWFNRAPPRRYPEDNFEASSYPIPNPDLRIVASLSDLGWGEMNQISEKLTKEGTSMEKVFYSQLQRHPMFNQGLDASKAVKSAPSTTRDTSAAAAGNKSQCQSQSAGQSSDKMGTAVAESDEKNVHHSQESSRVSSSVSWHGFDSNNDNGKPMGSSTSKTNLVRQSQLIRSATDASPKPEDDSTVEEAIQNVGGVQKSWFDSVRDYLTGQGGDSSNKGDKEKSHVDS